MGVPRKSMSGAPTPIYGMSCRSCFCNEIVILALAVIAIVSNAWTVSQSGSLPGISQVGLWGISCGSASPGYVNAEGEYIASNITAQVANSFESSFTNPMGQSTTCNEISPELAGVTNSSRFTIEDFYTLYLGDDYSVQGQIARACSIGFLAFGVVKIIIAFSKLYGCQYGGCAIWTTQFLQFAAGGAAFGAYMYIVMMAADSVPAVDLAPAADQAEAIVAAPTSTDPLKYAGWALWAFLVSVGLTFVGLCIHTISKCVACCAGGQESSPAYDEESQFLGKAPMNGMS